MNLVIQQNYVDVTDSPAGDYRADFKSCLAELIVLEPAGALLSRLCSLKNKPVPIFESKDILFQLNNTLEIIFFSCLQ